MPLIRNPGCVRGSYSARFLRQAERCTPLPPSLPPPSLPPIRHSPENARAIPYVRHVNQKPSWGTLPRLPSTLPSPVKRHHLFCHAGWYYWVAPRWTDIHQNQNNLQKMRNVNCTERNHIEIAQPKINYWQSLNVTTQSLQQLHRTDFLWFLSPIIGCVL